MKTWFITGAARALTKGDNVVATARCAAAIALLAPPAVAQRDRDGALGLGLADDEAIEFGYDFAGGEVCHGH